MKIHEYQGKDIFKYYGIPIQDGYVIEDINDALPTIEKVQKEFNTKAVVVKAQIHAGGRGKGGGVKYSPTTDIALKNTKEMLKKGCPFNFNELKKDTCLNSTYNGMSVTIDMVDDNPDKVRIFTLRSFGESFYHSVTDACLEFGYKGI